MEKSRILLLLRISCRFPHQLPIGATTVRLRDSDLGAPAVRLSPNEQATMMKENAKLRQENLLLVANNHALGRDLALILEYLSKERREEACQNTGADGGTSISSTATLSSAHLELLRRESTTLTTSFAILVRPPRKVPPPGLSAMTKSLLRFARSFLLDNEERTRFLDYAGASPPNFYETLNITTHGLSERVRNHVNFVDGKLTLQLVDRRSKLEISLEEILNGRQNHAHFGDNCDKGWAMDDAIRRVVYALTCDVCIVNDSFKCGLIYLYQQLAMAP